MPLATASPPTTPAESTAAADGGTPSRGGAAADSGGDGAEVSSPAGETAAAEKGVVSATYSLAYCKEDWAARTAAALADASPRLSTLAAPTTADVTV